ncbi:hypothetical protein, partial [Staphylococcus epidermidis]|uniref:hypothetical protein n=1 Tax=Staphylococcus epidermidis TaxID=1282 RepID=UPI0037DA610B
MHHPNIPQIQTPQPKTLTPTIPLYLNPLTPKPPYLITTNHYLPKPHFLQIKPLYQSLPFSLSLPFLHIPQYQY